METEVEHVEEGDADFLCGVLHHREDGLDGEDRDKVLLRRGRRLEQDLQHHVEHECAFLRHLGLLPLW